MHGPADGVLGRERSRSTIGSADRDGAMAAHRPGDRVRAGSSRRVGAVRRITLRDLLTMSSGLGYVEPTSRCPGATTSRRLTGSTCATGARGHRDRERARRAAALQQLQPAPGQARLERATGMTVSDYLRRPVAAPGRRVRRVLSLDGAIGLRADRRAASTRGRSPVRASPTSCTRRSEPRPAIVPGRGSPKRPPRTSTDPSALLQYFWWLDE